MLAISSENQQALEDHTIDVRDFLWFVVKDRDSGELVTDGMWSDVGNIAAPVINPATGLSETRNFYGAYSLVEISAVPRVHNVSVQEITITLSQTSNRAEQLVRLYDAKQARVEIFRGLYAEGTRLLVAPAFPRFVGFVDRVTITTPQENGEGSIELTCISHTSEMTRGNTETRSHENQILRDPTDNFFQDASTVKDWEMFWGKNKGKVNTQDAIIK